MVDYRRLNKYDKDPEKVSFNLGEVLMLSLISRKSFFFIIRLLMHDLLLLSFTIVVFFDWTIILNNCSPPKTLYVLRTQLFLENRPNFYKRLPCPVFHLCRINSLSCKQYQHSFHYNKYYVCVFT